MTNFDRNKIKSQLLEKYSKKVKKEVLEKNIESLVDEYIEIQQYILENGKNCNDLPTREDIKWWFQDKPELEEIEVSPGNYEKLLEVQIDAICLKDKIASFVFKHLYNYKWKQGTELNHFLDQLIKLNILAQESNSRLIKNKAKTRLANICLVGTVRFNDILRKPYLTQKQIDDSILYFRKVLSIIDKVSNGEFKDNIVTGEMYLFLDLKG
jgi:hypothetical protein